MVTSGKFALGYPRADGGEEIHADPRGKMPRSGPEKLAFDLVDRPVTAPSRPGRMHPKEASSRTTQESGHPTRRWHRVGRPFDVANSTLRSKATGVFGCEVCEWRRPAPRLRVTPAS